MKHSKTDVLKSADYSYDYPEEFNNDNTERIFNPIRKMGFTFDRYGANEWGDFIKEKLDKSYIFISVGDELSFSVNINLIYIIDSKKVAIEGFSTEIINESYVFSKNNLYLNFDKFKSGKCNICYITGLSGSGKSTLGKKLAEEYKANYIELDMFEHCSQMNEKEMRDSEVFFEYFTTNPELYNKLRKKTISSKELNSELCKFIDYVVGYCEKHKDEKYIIEGVQIYSHGDKKKIINKPIVFVNASIIKSMIQRFKRNSGGGKINWKAELENEFPQMLAWYLDNENAYKKFKKSIMGESDNREVVTEMNGIMRIFNKRKNDIENRKPLPSRVQPREYKVEDVKRDLQDIINFTTKIVKREFKDFDGKGIKIVKFNDSYYEEETADAYESGKSFIIFKYDLWDYPSKENPRTILGDEGDHPVYKVANDIVGAVEHYIESNSKYKGKYKIECCGDWDDGPYALVLI